mmetsp:Transcript_4023/g.11259  ORF Transcript_4023/g.11259 Transcript_4023/m.11259 type:complete len:188 (-) Transcript_4023:1358-1921(-)
MTVQTLARSGLNRCLAVHELATSLGNAARKKLPQSGVRELQTEDKSTRATKSVRQCSVEELAIVCVFVCVRVCVAPQGQKRQGHINWTCSSLRAAATRAAWDLEMNRTDVPHADLATEDGLAPQALFEGGGETGVDMTLGGAMWFTADSVNAGSKNHRNQRKPACWVDKILRCSSRRSLRPRSEAQK